MTNTTEATEPAQLPEDLMVYREWFPASVLLPSGEQWHRVRVYASTAGLLIFRAVKDLPDFWSPLDLEKTREPREGLVINVGLDLYTEDGLVVVTPTGGGSCCGTNGSFKRWRPAFATHLTAWAS